jgi:capsule polysaccharide export protein KpsE/RkpR
MGSEIAKSEQKTLLPESEMETEFSPQPTAPELVERRIARLRLLWDQRGWLFRVAGIGLLCATMIAFLIPARYESTVRLMPPDSESNMGMAMLAALTGRGGGNLAALGNSVLGLKSSGSLFIGILESRTVEDNLVAKFDLQKVYWTRRLEDTRKELAKNTDISENRKSGIITIRVTDKNPQRAAAMGRQYVEELNRVVNQLSTSSAHRERVFLEGRLKAVQSDLEQAEKEFSQFASKNTAIDIKEQGKAMVGAVATLQGELIAAQSQLEGLRQIYTENNVRVRALRARVFELQNQLKKIGGKTEIAPSVGGIKDDSLYPSIRELPLLGVAYADLYRRTKMQEAAFEILTQEYELAKVQEAKEIPSVKVLDSADVPEKRSFPPRLLIVFLGTCVSLACAAAWIFGNAAWHETDAHDPRKVFAQEIFTTVKAKLPAVSRNGSGLRRMKSEFPDQG